MVDKPVCPSCGYEVEAPSMASPCPECGFPRTQYAAPEELLRHCSDRRVRSILRGLSLFVASIYYLVAFFGLMLVVVFASIGLELAGLTAIPFDDTAFDAGFVIAMSVGVLLHSIAVWLITTPLEDHSCEVGRILTRLGVAFAPLCAYPIAVAFVDWPRWVMWPQLLAIQAASFSYFMGLISWLGHIEWRTAAWIPGLRSTYKRLRWMSMLLLVAFAWGWWMRLRTDSDENDWGVLWALLLLIVIGFDDVRRVRGAVRIELATLRGADLPVGPS